MTWALFILGVLWRAAVLLVVLAALGAAVYIVLSPFLPW